MNRLKLWIYMLLLLGAGAANLYFLTGQLVDRSLASLDRSLSIGHAQVDAEVTALARAAVAIAGVSARYPDLRDALQASAKPPKGKRGQEAESSTGVNAAFVAAARAGIETASREVGLGAAPLLGYVVTREGKAAKAIGIAGFEVPLGEYVRQSASGARQGFARLGDDIWYVASVPASESISVVVALPLDSEWANRVRRGTDVDVTLVGLRSPLSTLEPKDAAAIEAAAKRPFGATGIGKLKPVKLHLPFNLPVSMPAIPLLFARAPAFRAEGNVVSKEDVRDVMVVLSRPTAPFLEPLAVYQQLFVAALGLALILGLIFGLLVRSAEEAPHIPKDLLAAADRIARGEFDARAPELAGKMGTLASALNRAAEAASTLAAAPTSGAGTPLELPGSKPLGSEPLDSTAPEFFARGDALSPPPKAAEPAPQAVSSTGKLPSADPFRPAAAPPPAPPPPAAVLQQAAQVAPPPPPPAAKSEEDEWQELFEKFLRVRNECGEPSEGLTYDRFRVKLEKNRDQLIQKYACKGVRFDVYVKEGKAALKATPVR